MYLVVNASISGLILVLATAATAKIVAAVRPLLKAFGCLEVAVAVALLIPAAQLVGLAVALGLSLAFTAGALRASEDGDCLCFGTSFRAAGRRSRLMRSESALPELQAAVPRMRSTDVWLVYRDHPSGGQNEHAFAAGLVISREAFAQWNVRGVPYAVVVSPAGRVEAKGDLLGVGRLLETLAIEPTDHLVPKSDGTGDSDMEVVTQ